MNISEAAKKAANECAILADVNTSDVQTCSPELFWVSIQSAIDAETKAKAETLIEKEHELAAYLERIAARDAEIARLRKEVARLENLACQKNYLEIANRNTMVEALRKIAEHASNHDAYALKDMAIEALQKVGAE